MKGIALKRRPSTSLNAIPDDPTITSMQPMAPDMEALRGDEEEFELLGPGKEKSTASDEPSNNHDNLTAPLMTRGALLSSGCVENTIQYGVLGRIMSFHSKSRVDIPKDYRLYMNINAPMSVLVCGVQGSGKSHTVASMLESMFISDDPRLGRLSKPLSGLVLHMSDGGLNSTPSEAAWVGVASDDSISVPKVTVYVSPSSLNTMKTVYKPLGTGIKVVPFYIAEEELDAQAFLSMMAVGSPDAAPLYVHMIMSILRELGERFTYKGFLDRVKKTSFNPAQEAGLRQRMALLDSFMEKKPAWNPNFSSTGRFKEGEITIFDLSDPFIDPASACGIFETVIRLFVRANIQTGKAIVVDEAHKYLSTNDSAAGLTKSLLTLIREQRHKAMRVIISTQEPTVVPQVIIDLCTVCVLHRFSSPTWWEHVTRHISADVSADAFDRLVKLKAGEAFIFAPMGICLYPTVVDGLKKVVVGQFGRKYLQVQVRQRVTEDGGASVMVL